MSLMHRSDGSIAKCGRLLVVMLNQNIVVHLFQETVDPCTSCVRKPITV